MPINPKDFFENYVLPPYDAWICDELCEWKAFAAAGALNALVDHAFLHDNPTRKVTDRDYKKALGDYRQNLPNAEDHRHIRFVAEIYKHVEREKDKDIPRSMDDMAHGIDGAFTDEFTDEFDVARRQLGFPYQKTRGGPGTWVPLRQVATRCVEYWRRRL